MSGWGYKKWLIFGFSAVLVAGSVQGSGLAVGSTLSLSLSSDQFRRACLQTTSVGREQLEIVETSEVEADGDYLKSLNQFAIQLGNMSNLAGLFQSVHPAAVMRDEATECEQRLATLLTDIGMSESIAHRVEQIDVSKLDSATQRYVTKLRQDSRRAGVNKSPVIRAEIKRLSDEIVVIGQTFNRNIREDVREIRLQSIEQLAGLPEDYVQSHRPKANGEIVITTNYPDLIPYLRYAEHDSSRKALYITARNRGYPANETVLKSLLVKRHQLATLLGYRDYASYATEVLMTQTPEHVASFLDQLSLLGKPAADRDYQRLLKRLRQIEPKATAVQAWQSGYLSELIKTESYQVDSKQLRQFFSYARVKQGLFELLEELFSIEIRPWKTDVWHESVEAWEIVEQGQVIARFFLDMHPREAKYKPFHIP